jgi:hypothetical protein
MAALHVHAWRAAYAVTEPELAPAERVILVAAEGEQLLGFCTAGHARSDDELGLGEIYALNVDPPAWGGPPGARCRRPPSRGWTRASASRSCGSPPKTRARGGYASGRLVVRRRREDGVLRRHRRQALPVPLASAVKAREEWYRTSRWRSRW